MYLAIGGIDGCGKSTLRRRLVSHLDSRGMEVVGFSEPYHPFVKELLETTESAWTDVLLFALDRWMLKPKLESWIEEDRTLIASRSIYCSLAYQGAQGLSWEEILNANNWKELILPDVFLLVDIDPSTAMSRASGREKFEKRGFLRKVRREYMRIYSSRDEFPSQMLLVDSSGSSEQTFKRAMDSLRDFLPLGDR